VEKSLGAVSKGGSTPLRQVVDYAEPVTESGLALMNTPGFDPVSITGLVAGGCNLVAFTTGRGSVYGCSIAPTLKIATTTELFQRMRGDMDFDAGRILSGQALDEAAVEVFQLLVDVAGGKPTCSEILSLGREEFVPWPVGETL
jgi:altronate hydrolase